MQLKIEKTLIDGYEEDYRKALAPMDVEVKVLFEKKKGMSAL